MSFARMSLIGAALGVAALDLLQVLLLPWQSRHYGAIGGALLYSVVAAGAWRGHRWASLVAVAVPALPLSILALTALGADLPVVPDRVMVGILAVQLVAAAAGAVTARRAAPPSGTTPRSSP